MRKLSFAFGGLLTLSVGFSGAVQAADQMVQLATEKGCFICHAVKAGPEGVVPLAPSYEEIAARYKGQGGVFENLVDRVLHGTAYTQQNWPDRTSMRFMPPNVNVSREEGAALVHWILEGEGASKEAAEHTQVLALATNAGCMTCHLVDANRDARLIPLAPSFREIAARFSSQDGAKAILVKSVKQGTSFKEKTWHKANMRFMPPNPQLRNEDAEALVDWILALQ